MRTVCTLSVRRRTSHDSPRVHIYLLRYTANRKAVGARAPIRKKSNTHTRFFSICLIKINLECIASIARNANSTSNTKLRRIVNLRTLTHLRYLFFSSSFSSSISFSTSTESDGIRLEFFILISICSQFCATFMEIKLSSQSVSCAV